jgi:hypothetical protein
MGVEEGKKKKRSVSLRCRWPLANENQSVKSGVSVFAIPALPSPDQSARKFDKNPPSLFVSALHLEKPRSENPWRWFFDGLKEKKADCVDIVIRGRH